MAGERLTGSDKRALFLWVLLGIIGAVFAQKYYFRAFPEASVNFKVPRAEALARARNFVSSLGENIGGYQSTIVFDVDDNAKTYLERELGLQQANQLMSSELNVWYWDVRFFKPQQEEEFRVWVNPAGTVVGYEHKVEDARAGASLDRQSAQVATQNYVTGKLGINLSQWDLLPEEANSSKKPNRTDWSFTWEKHGFRAKDAPYRLQATVQGDSIGGSREMLHVPEEWERGYTQLRSTNIFYNQIAIIPYFLLMGSALWVGISLTKQGQTTWRGAITLGILVAALFFLMQVNEWESARANYDTTSSYASFVVLQIAKAIFAAAGTALLVTLVLPGAEPLYRASQPMRLRLSKVFTLRGLRSKEFFSAAVVGLSLAAAHIGFIVAFYMLGSKVGVWAPQDLSYSDAVNTSFPWIAGVAIGLMAATSEEFLFRLFAIPFIERVTKSRVLAVILPAFSWSFLHSAYPQEPGYIRGIEVGIIGVVAGVVMLRWGILATLIWHYTVDASLVGLLLVRSNSLYFKISGVIVGAAALAPLAFAVISYVSRGSFEADEDLLNRAAPAPEIVLASAPTSAKATESTGRYEALAPGMIGFLAVCLLLGGVLAWHFKPQAVGDYLQLSVNARTARVRADEILRQRGMDPASYYRALLLVNTTDSRTNEFLRQRIGATALDNIYAQQVPGALWRARYFRDREPEEFAVVLKPDGSLHSVHHTLPENAPGASLSKEEAILRAAVFLKNEKNIDLSQWTLVEGNSEKRPHRIDHTLTWQQNAALDAPQAAPTILDDHAHARIELTVLGDEVTSYRTYIKIPDDWRRQQEQLTLSRTILSYGLPVVLLVGLALTAVIVFLMNLRSEAVRSIPWRRLTLWSLGGLLAYVTVFALGNRIPAFLNEYQTSIAFKTMLGGLAIGALLGALIYFGAIALLFGTAWYYAYRAFGGERLPGTAGMPASYYWDAVWIGAGGAAALIGVARVLDAASTHWPTLHRGLDAAFGQDFDATLPAAAISANAVLRALFATGIVALLAGFVGTQLRHRWTRYLLFLLSALALVGSNWGSPADFAKQFLVRLITLGVLVFGVRSILRFNILGCFLLVAGISLLTGATQLLNQPDAFYRSNGYAVLLMLALLFAWPLAVWRMRSGAASVSQSG